MKCQDGNGSTYDDGPEDHSKKPQEKSQMLVQPKKDDDDPNGPDPSNPESKVRGRDELMDFTNTEDFPVDMNADDAEALFKAYMAKQQRGYRT